MTREKQGTPIHRDDPERWSQDAPPRHETQTTFEQHPDHGSMMKGALAVAAIHSTRVHIEHLYAEQREHVDTARSNGVSWQKIGDALGITRSAAQQYYGK